MKRLFGFTLFFLLVLHTPIAHAGVGFLGKLKFWESQEPFAAIKIVNKSNHPLEIYLIDNRFPLDDGKAFIKIAENIQPGEWVAVRHVFDAYGSYDGLYVRLPQGENRHLLVDQSRDNHPVVFCIAAKYYTGDSHGYWRQYYHPYISLAAPFSRAKSKKTYAFAVRNIR